MGERHGLLGPAAHFKHEHAPVRNVNEVAEEKQTLGQRIADRVASTVGSWPFIIVQSCVLVMWMAANVYLAMHWKDKAFDPYPFILLNLVLSFQAAYTGPVVMMSQNRQSEKDRLMAENDYQVNKKAEDEIKVILQHQAYQNSLLITMLEKLGVSKDEAEANLKAHGVLDPLPER